MPGGEVADGLTDRDGVSDVDGGDHGFIRGPQAARVLDADDAPPSDRPGEGDHASAGGPDGFACHRTQIHAAMTGHPRPGRWVEGPQDRRYPGQRPGP